MKRNLKALLIAFLSLFYDVRVTRRGRVHIELKKHNREGRRG